jgi:Spy/CpxP family protein refolding chaperone
MGTIAPRAGWRAAWMLAGIGLLGAGIVLWPRTGRSQADPHDHAKHTATVKSAGGDEALADQVKLLKDKVARLESALSQGQGGGQPSAMGRGPGMTMGAMAGDTTTVDGARVAPQFQDCARCHQTRPSGSLPSSHLEKPSGMRRGAMGKGAGMSMMSESGMGMMRGGSGGMGMMDGMMGMMGQGGMEAGPSKGMTGDDGMTGMGAMGKAKRMGMGMDGMKMSSSLPGFPGASHLYHIGAEGFFLNHDVHITLSADQQKKLSRIKEKALLGGSSCERKVEEAEQELWELTASDVPDAEAIEHKVREIEKLRGDERLAYIRAVGEAAKVLTEQQREVLVGAAGASDMKH